MKLLLDTHVVIWSVLGDPALPARFRAALADPEAEVFISAASVWEVAIKRALGKLPVPQDMFDRAVEAGCVALAVNWAHARAVEALPFKFPVNEASIFSILSKGKFEQSIS